jgi:cytidyltransferase-like protein
VDKVVVCTIGSWDILHRGHIEYLKKAREEGDILVVGVDSDVALRRYKRRNEYYPQADRQEIVAAIQGVDYVTVVDDVDLAGDWQMGLVKAIQPDVFVCNDKTYPEAQRRKLQALCQKTRAIAFYDPPSPLSSVAVLEEIKRTLQSVSAKLAEIGLAGERSGDRKALASPISGRKIFIGHGRSDVWKDLLLFLRDRLKLDCIEYNSDPTAGLSTKERLEDMLNQAAFAFLVMTAEDEHGDGSRHARENVIHEAGLFQGKVGFKRAIILLEEGCTEFANIQGLGQIRFSTNNIKGTFEEIRGVLERERLLRAMGG